MMEGVVMSKSRWNLSLLAGFSILLFFAACSTTDTAYVDVGKASRAETGKVHITRITYSNVEAGTSVRVYGTGKLEYTSYKLSDPFRLAVEIPDVMLDFEPNRIELDDADISSLSVVRFPKIDSVRIEMGLFANAPFSINSNSGYLEIVISHKSAAKPGGVAAATDIDVVDTADETATLEETPENLPSQKEMPELLEENMLLKQRLEKTLAQLEKTVGMAKALRARNEFMETKLSELQATSGQLPSAGLKTGLPLPSPALMEVEKETPKSADADSREALEEIRKMLDSWLTAWNWKDFLKYSAYYASDFKTGDMNRNKWLKDKEQKFARPGAIEVKVQKVRIKLQDTRNAVAVFRQAFKSPGYRDKGVKTLTLVKKGAGWQVISESWKTL